MADADYRLDWSKLKREQRQLNDADRAEYEEWSDALTQDAQDEREIQSRSNGREWPEPEPPLEDKSK